MPMLSKYNLELVPISHSTVSNTGRAERKINIRAQRLLGHHQSSHSGQREDGAG